MSFLVNPFVYGAGSVGTKRVAVKNFAMNTSTGNQTVTTTDLGGLTPKGAILFVSAIDSNKGNQTDGAYFSIGATDGTTQWAIFGTDKDAVSSETTRRGHNTGILHRTLNRDTGLTSSEAVFDSFTTNGIVLNITDAPSISYLCTVILFAGTAVSVDADHITGVTTAGLSVTTGFQPDVVFFGSALRDGVTLIGNSDAFSGSFGWAVDLGGSIGHQSMQWFRASGADAEAMTAHNGYWGQVINGSATVAARLSMTSFDGSGFTVDTDVDTAVDFFSFAVKIDGASFFSGRDTAKPTTTGTKSLTGAGLQPNVAIMMSAGLNASHGTDARSKTDDMNCGFHAFTSTQIGGTSFMSVSFGTSQCNSSASNSSIYQILSDGVAHYEATLSSFDVDGYTLNYSDAASSQEILPVLLIGGLD